MKENKQIMTLPSLLKKITYYSQVECIKLLYDKMLALRKKFLNTEIAYKFPRPIFRIAILYVSEKESLERQLARGAKVKEHNQRVWLLS